jgi:hypothetical protein
MNKYQPKFSLFLYAAFTLLAVVIIVDFVWPGKIIKDEVLDVQWEREQYYNAARNYHYSYKVITSEHQFYVAEDFAQLVQDAEKIEYSVSRIFKEVNWYRLLNEEKRSFYSLRILSGLVLPLLAMLLFLLAYRYKWKSDILVFVIQVLLIADLIFLIL